MGGQIKMLSNFLVKTFIKDSENIKDRKVRNSYGFLGGIIGIVVNLILFAIKFTVGFLVSSIAVTADAFNNLSDVASSVITIAGFKMANMPPDEKHPFGHGRMEYLSGLVVAFMVMLVGFQFVKSSFDKINILFANICSSFFICSFKKSSAFFVCCILKIRLSFGSSLLIINPS